MGERAASSEEAEILAEGTVLAGRYRIEGVLGSGGMGRVYRAEHTAMSKPVAVKVLHTALGRNQEASARFQREAIASGRLDHPNIVSVMDFGVLDDGCLYMVMELLEGEHLGAKLQREKRLAWPDALSIIRGVLLGLRHAHDRGVVHRDIKPDNIFLANKDEEQIVKVLDFGIAKLYAGNVDNLAATRAGLTVGTPTYLSPEQAVGGAITPACDIYSTSVVLYEMLVGRAPFEAEDPISLLTSHAGAEVPPFAQLAPDLEVPDGLEALVRTGLAKFPAERVHSALDYVQQLDDILRANGLEPPPLPSAPRPSQSIGIPVGPYARSTPPPGMRTPAPGMLSPSPDFLAAPTPPPEAAAEPAPAPARARVATPAAGQRAAASPSVRSEATPRKKRGWIVAGALVVVAAGGAAAWSLHGHGGAKATAAEPAHATATTQPAVHKPAPAAAAPAPPAPAPHPPATQASTARTAAPRPAASHLAAEHEARLEAALHELIASKTCLTRKKAIPTLVALGDPKALPFLKKARTYHTNLCLRASADQAIKTLSRKK